MNESPWSDRRFREFLTLLGGGTFAPPIDDAERDAFLRQARRRLVPEVRRRLLAETGAVVDPYGVVLVAFELLQDCVLDHNTHPDRVTHLDDETRTRLRKKYEGALGVLGEPWPWPVG